MIKLNDFRQPEMVVFLFRFENKKASYEAVISVGGIYSIKSYKLQSSA